MAPVPRAALASGALALALTTCGVIAHVCWWSIMLDRQFASTATGLFGGTVGTAASAWPLLPGNLTACARSQDFLAPTQDSWRGSDLLDGDLAAVCASLAKSPAEIDCLGERKFQPWEISTSFVMDRKRWIRRCSEAHFVLIRESKLW